MYPTIRFGQALIEQRLRNHHCGPHRRLQSPLDREIGGRR
jgi:hypothetical protein